MPFTMAAMAVAYRKVFPEKGVPSY
jgi:hypothetical protein